MNESDPREVGRIIALRLLEIKPRTEGELRHALCERGIPDDVAAALVARYVEVGLLDDQAYARMWVESRMRSKGLGRAALRQELRRHKVPEPVIEQTLAELHPEDTRSAAVDAVRPKVARCALPLTPGDERRLVNFLMRRGHNLDTARRALKEAVEQVAAAS